MRRSILIAFALLTVATLPGSAQEFPSRVVRLVVPAAGGSTTDTIARLLADQLSKKWPQSVIVENISGGR